MEKYKVVEIFTSINGEGMDAGKLSVFVRFQGCNLRCNYCDTMWANEETCAYTWMSADEIVEKVKEADVRNVTITGGEPLLQKDIWVLLDKLIDFGVKVEIETNGSVDISKFIHGDRRPVFTLDYKLAGSGMEQQMLMSNYEYVCKDDTVKFVVSDTDDLNRAYDICKTYRLGEKCNIILSPVFGRIEPEQMVEFMKEKHFNEARIGLQLHKIIWDPDKTGV